jgi:ABC-type multidrug transport system ATPase subunit
MRRLLPLLLPAVLAQGPPSAPSPSPTPCPYQPLLGRCAVSAFAFPTKLCNVDPNTGGLDPNNCLSECGPGWYCPNVRNCGPNGSTPEGNPWNLRPEYCPPTIACATTRLGSGFCAAAQGEFEPLLCPPGSYCPDQHTIVPCPAGSFCMRGSVAPTACPGLSWCPAGTTIRRIYGGVLACVLLDLLLVALFYVWRDYYEPAVWGARAKWVLQQFGGAEGMELEDVGGAPPLVVRIKDGMRSAFAGGGLSAALADTERPLLLAGGPAAPAGDGAFASVKAAAKRRLFASFRSCNKDFDMSLWFTNLKVEVMVREEGGGGGGIGGLFSRPMRKKVLLESASGFMLPKKVTAIMGPSGAGKTTLLNCIFGRIPRAMGELHINGTPREMSHYKKLLGFVPQDDLVIKELTVRENILFSARVRLPNTAEWTDARVQEHVDAVIGALGLTEQANLVVTKLSGGQRKRTNIGIELAAAPAAIFLDEPTSGLDASKALEVCNTLRDIANMGVLVVTVIHQPRFDIYEQFDELILLAKGGFTAYVGPREYATAYFKEVARAETEACRWEGNAADVLMDFCNKEGPHIAGATIGEDGPLAALRDAEEGQRSSGSDASALDASVASDGRSWGQQLAELWRLKGAEFLERAAAKDGKPPPPSPMRPSGGGSSESFGSLRGSPAPPAGSLQQDVAPAAHFNEGTALSQRGASFLAQAALCHNRSLLQQYRAPGGFALEVGVAVLAGGMMGAAALAVPSLYVGVLKGPYVLISPSPIESLLPSIGLYVALAIAVAASPAGVKIFGEEREIYFREAASGHNTLSYYLGKSFAVLFRTLVGAFHFTSIFHLLASPAQDFFTLLVLVLCQYFCIYGLAAITSMLVARENSALLGVICGLIVSCLNGYGPNLHQGAQWNVGWLQQISFSRWAAEGFFHAETFPFRNHYMVTEVSAGIWGYTLDRFGFDVFMMVLLGLVERAVAYVLMVSIDRDVRKALHPLLRVAPAARNAPHSFAHRPLPTHHHTHTPSTAEAKVELS